MFARDRIGSGDLEQVRLPGGRDHAPRLCDQFPVHDAQNPGIADGSDQGDRHRIGNVLRSHARNQRVEMEHRVLEARVSRIELPSEAGQQAVILPPVPHASERPEFNQPDVLPRDTEPSPECIERRQLTRQDPAARDGLHARVADARDRPLERREQVPKPEIRKDVRRGVVHRILRDVDGGS
jgi:hypothetical protein